MIAINAVDSLQKLWPESHIEKNVANPECFQNEIAGVQIAVKNTGVPMRNCRFAIESSVPVSLRRVGYVPGDFTYHPDSDEYVLGKNLHLFPDPLLPVSTENFVLKGNSLNVFWMTLGSGECMAPGKYPVRVILYDEKGEAEGEVSFTLTVLEGVLPESDLVVTDWMHYDCICNYYRVKPFGKKFTALTESFLDMALRHGINAVYVPLFTPPLDTEVGGERTTVQLIGVEQEGKEYRFDFSRLDKLLRRADKLGAKYFEFSHLFTQWGAQAAPKIEAKRNGQTEKIFGWETPADGAAYTGFLESFLPRLGSFLKEKGLAGRSFFHISDEPSAYWLKDYTARRALFKRLLPDFVHIDALSEIEFLEKGLVDIPVAVTEVADKFAASGKEYWVYYCFPQCKDNLSNRMMNMPSERTRILGMQLYRNGAKGFLHWGYNFYNTALSLRSVNPFFETDAGGFFQSGDSFIVYPGEEGALSSVRLEVFREAMQDYRALMLLESRIGKEETLAFLREEQINGFTQYPHGSENFLNLRRRLNEKIIASGGRS